MRAAHYPRPVAKVLIVGGGIVGITHALEAIARGFDVEHFEASAEPRDATPRSPGTLHFSRAASGVELRAARDAAERWQALGVGSAVASPTGSLVIARDDNELALLEMLGSRPDAPERGWSVLDVEGTRAVNPALAGRVTGSLHSGLDIVVQPRLLLEQLHRRLSDHSGYRFHGGTKIRDVGGDSIEDANGRVHRGDLVVLCTGSDSDLTMSAIGRPAQIRTVRLQLAQTERCGLELPTPVSEPAALLYCGIAADGSLDGFLPPSPAASLIGDQEIALTCVQRANGSLTFGEVRQQEEPFDFGIDRRPLDLLTARMAEILGSPMPPVVRQWDGEVRLPTGGRLWIREDLGPTVTLITGTGQRGITLAPSIAAETFDWLTEDIDSGATRPGADQRSVD